MSATQNSLQRKKPPFRADHVGSLLRPARIKEARSQFARGELTADGLRAIEDEEIRRIVEGQKKTGILAITDGELRRAWWHLDFMENLTGVEGFDAETGYKFHGVETKPHNVRITGKIDFNTKHPFLNHFKFLKGVVGDAGPFVAKQTIPSPNMFMHLNVRDNPVYSSLDAYCDDLARTYQKTIKAFYDIGCRYLQLDDVFWAYLSDPKSHEKERAAGNDPQKIIDRCAKTLNMALEGKPRDMAVTMHVCRGNFASTWIYQGGYDAVSKALGSVRVDGFFLEFDDERSGGFEPLKYCDTQQVVLGLITSKTAQLESPDAIKKRIEAASRYVPLERLALSPQCGFASTEEGNKLTEDEQWAKLKLVVDIAKDVWGK